jgi:hypothetical protein
MTDEMMLRALEELREREDARAADPFGLAGQGSGSLDGGGMEQSLAGLEPPEPEMVRRMAGELIRMPIEEHPWLGRQEMTEEAFEQAMHQAIAPAPAEMMADGTIEDTTHHVPLPEPAEEAVAEPATAFQEMEAYYEQQQASLEEIVRQAMPEPEEVLEEEEDPWEFYQRQMMDPGMMGFGPMPGP